MDDLFATLADRTRLRILNLLAQGEVCVCYFTAILDLPQPTVSRHLAHLREAGLVVTRREGKWVHYSLLLPSDDGRARVLRVALDAIAEEREMTRDREALERVCCATRLPRGLSGAPRPSLRGRRA